MPCHRKLLLSKASLSKASLSKASLSKASLSKASLSSPEHFVSSACRHVEQRAHLERRGVCAIESALDPHDERFVDLQPKVTVRVTDKL